MPLLKHMDDVRGIAEAELLQRLDCPGIVIDAGDTKSAVKSVAERTTIMSLDASTSLR